MIYVLGGEAALYFASPRLQKRFGNPMGLPRGYGMCFDPSGAQLCKCSLFFGPIAITESPAKIEDTFARGWFGSDYEPRKATIDVPERRWKPVGAIREILYYRVGAHEGDWKHEFAKPVPLLQQGRWWKLELPRGCKVSPRGLEYP